MRRTSSQMDIFIENAGQAPSQEEIKAIKTQLDQIVTSACEEGSGEKQQVSRQETGQQWKCNKKCRWKSRCSRKRGFTEKYDPC